MVLVLVVFYFDLGKAGATVSDHVTLIEMSKEWDYGFPGDPQHYDFDVCLFADAAPFLTGLPLPIRL